jgi:hypothetical protein
MSFDVNLSKQAEAHLREQAIAMGMSLEVYVTKLLEASARPAAKALTGTKLVEYWAKQGVIGTRRDITDSLEHARQIRAEAERRSA